jgi:hypothetical protein
MICFTARHGNDRATVAAALARAVARGCLLCGGPAGVARVFCPDDQASVKSPPGKSRAVCYGLCDDCFNLPDRESRAEEKIFAEMAGDAA